MKTTATFVAICLFSAPAVLAIPAALTPDIEARALVKVITKCTVANTAALTFDDGPYKYEAKVVKTLNDMGAKGTFFVNGNNYDCIYDSAQATDLKAAYKAGHQIASHTWAHLDLTQQSKTKIDSEMSRTENAIKKITGAHPAFTRPPYGNYNDNVRSVAANRGQKLVNWDFDSGDSVGATTTESKNKYAAIAKKHPSNILALNHETEPGTVNTVLPYAIKTLNDKGYKLVTVAQCLGTSAYTSTGGSTTRDSTWHC